MALTSAQQSWLGQVDGLLAEAGTTREELEFPFLAWFERNVDAEWIVDKALNMPKEEAA